MKISSIELYNMNSENLAKRKLSVSLIQLMPVSKFKAFEFYHFKIWLELENSFANDLKFINIFKILLSSIVKYTYFHCEALMKISY